MDLAFTVALWVVQVIFAALGCWVSLKKLNQEKRQRFWIWFVVLAVVGLSLMAWQDIRNKASNGESIRNAMGWTRFTFTESALLNLNNSMRRS
jgi:thiol:disulfide interchange protein